jgi:hypothetical protein
MSPVTAALRSDLLRRDTNPERLAQRVAQHVELLDELIGGLDVAVPAIRFGSARVLRCLSHARPGLLAPHIEAFVDRLAVDNRFLACDMRLILANLAEVDIKQRLRGVLDRYFAPLLGPVLMVAATTVKGAATIGLGRPELAEDIARRLTAVSGGCYGTMESRDVMIRHAIQAIDSLLAEVEHPAAAIRWVRRHRDHPNAVTRAAARRLLGHWV